MIVMNNKVVHVIDKFNDMRLQLASIACILHANQLTTYKSNNEFHYLLCTEEISNTAIVTSTPSGVSISLPYELRAIVNCEYDYMRITNDAVIFGMKSLYIKHGDNREFNVVLPITQKMSLYLQDCKTIDLGMYTNTTKNEYTYISDQFFDPEYINLSLYNRQPISDNWIQNTLSGKNCMSLEQQEIEISNLVGMDVRKYLDSLDVVDKEKTELLKVILCIKPIK